MKIKTIDATTKTALRSGTQVQLQVKGKDSGFLSLKTGDNGDLQLDNKYEGQQITASLHGQGTWITATEGATLRVETTKQRQGETTSSGAGIGGSSRK